MPDSRSTVKVFCSMSITLLFKKYPQMNIDEKYLRKILQAVMDIGDATVEAISEATGICEECVERYLQAAEKLGFVNHVA
jgi:hypothetical protein